MSKKPEKLDQIWSEKDLCARLDLPRGKGGRSRQLGYWIRGGLRHIEKSGQRFFFEQDVIDYLWRSYDAEQSWKHTPLQEDTKKKLGSTS